MIDVHEAVRRKDHDALADSLALLGVPHAACNYIRRLRPPGGLPHAELVRRLRAAMDYRRLREGGTKTAAAKDIIRERFDLTDNIATYIVAGKIRWLADMADEYRSNGREADSDIDWSAIEFPTR